MKLYTPPEANALLPHLAPALVELREKFEAAQKVRAAMASSAATNGGSPDHADRQRLLARVEELVERIASWGVELKDVATGLVDFPATVDGEDAFLCWRLGEPEVAYWHPRDAGFAGRRPL